MGYVQPYRVAIGYVHRMGISPPTTGAKTMTTKALTSAQRETLTAIIAEGYENTIRDGRTVRSLVRLGLLQTVTASMTVLTANDGRLLAMDSTRTIPTREGIAAIYPGAI